MVKNFATARKQWGGLSKSHGLTDKATMQRFFARYELASRFESINAKGYVATTLSAYSAMFKVYLAYSATEVFFAAAKRVKKADLLGANLALLEIDDAQLAAQLRSNSALISILLEYIDKGRPRDILIKFINCQSNNVLPIAKFIRHLVAHGSLSANSACSRKAVHRKTLETLAQLTLRKIESVFTEFIHSLETQLKKKTQLSK